MKANNQQYVKSHGYLSVNGKELKFPKVWDKILDQISFYTCGLPVGWPLGMVADTLFNFSSWRCDEEHNSKCMLSQRDNASYMLSYTE